LVTAATAAGARLARHRPSQRQIWFAAADGALLIIAGLHLLPDARAGARAARIWPGPVPIAAAAMYAAVGLAARAGCGCQEHKEQASGAGTAAALAVHRFVEGAAVAVDGSAVVTLALAAHASGEDLATGALPGAQSRRRVVQRIHAVFYHQGAPPLGEGALRTEQALAGLRAAAAVHLSTAGQQQVATALDMLAAVEAQPQPLRHQLRQAAAHLTGARVLAPRLYGAGPVTGPTLTLLAVRQGPVLPHPHTQPLPAPPPPLAEPAAIRAGSRPRHTQKSGQPHLQNPNRTACDHRPIQVRRVLVPSCSVIRSRCVTIATRDGRRGTR
jgi:hypothetical protein